ncbi:HPr kinase/phosphorylase [Parasphingorhabdus sp.]|uniref:HPr kinase/phosphorylase n=1 Tax=Parasphingorhabdus sp. TaxID=2709688 RepID=UPI0030011261
MTNVPNQDDQLTTHANAVAISGAGVMICGSSGSGKSDLALRLIDRGAALIADDYVDIKRTNRDLLLSPPANLAGKLEIRSLGIFERDHLSGIPLKMVVNLQDNPERFPLDRQIMNLLGINIPFCTLNAMESSAAIKVEWALQQILQDSVSQ